MTKFFTYERVDVTNRIENGLTTGFSDKKDAEKFAEQKRSYTYELFKEDKQHNLIHAGYAVPN